MTKVIESQFGILSKEDTTDNKQSSELVERTPIQQTPFTVVTIEGKNFGAISQYRITDSYETKEEVITELEKVTWDRLVQVIAILIEKMNNNPIKAE